MLLSENRQVVGKLMLILENYDYLEYDKKGSKNKDFLKVKVVNLDAERHLHDVGNICRELEQVTEMRFYVRSYVNAGFRITEWTHFNIREDRD